MQRYNLQRGFTLVELLIVLTVLGAVSAFAAPNLWNSLQRANERREVLGYGSELQALRRELYFSGGSILVEANALAKGVAGIELPSVPQGWTVTQNSELSFFATGVTGGGSIRFQAPSGRSWMLTMTQLDGDISVDGAD